MRTPTAHSIVLRTPLAAAVVIGFLVTLAGHDAWPGFPVILVSGTEVGSESAPAIQGNGSISFPKTPQVMSADIGSQ